MYGLLFCLDFGFKGIKKIIMLILLPLNNEALYRMLFLTLDTPRYCQPEYLLKTLILWNMEETFFTICDSEMELYKSKKRFLRVYFTG